MSPVLPLPQGTENVALIAGLGAASKLAREEADELLVHMLALKLRLILRLQDKLSSVKVLHCTVIPCLHCILHGRSEVSHTGARTPLIPVLTRR